MYMTSHVERALNAELERYIYIHTCKTVLRTHGNIFLPVSCKVRKQWQLQNKNDNNVRK